MTARKRDPVLDYARAVVRKTKPIVAGPYVRAACRRHLADMKNRKKTGLVWDLPAALKKIRFFPAVLRLASGQFEGKPFDLFDWEAFVIGSLFGWKQANGARRFRTAYIETGKGSGKTPLCAGIGLVMLCGDSEERAEIYAAAYNHDQAKVLFRNAVAMVEQSPDLMARLEMSGGMEKDNIAYLKTHSFFRPISSERQGRGRSGPIPHCGLLDEIHEHPTNAMVEFMDAGSKHRTQPLIIMITNSGSDRATVCWDYHDYGSKVAEDRLKDDSFFAYICAMDGERKVGSKTVPADDPFTDEGCWIKANPSLPVVPGYDYIRGQVTRAKGLPSKETLCKRLNFCMWTDAVDAWVTKDVWDSVQFDLNLADYLGMKCYGGLDLSISSDLTALSLAFEISDRHWDVFSWFWMPGERLLELQDRDNMAPRYQEWRDAGHLQAPPWKVIDYDHAAELVIDICNKFDVQAIAYDRAKIESFLVALAKNGGEEVPLIEHGQGFYKAKATGLWMPGSIEETEAGFTENRIRIAANPVMTWCVASAVCQQSSIVPTDRFFKKSKSSGRIDGAVSLVECIGAAAGKGEDLTTINYTSGQMFGRIA